MDVKSSKTRVAAIATATIMTSLGATACGSASGSSGSDGVYVDQEDGREVLVIDGDAVSAARTRGTTDDRCGRFEILMRDAENGELDPENVHPGDPNGYESYTNVYIGTMNEARTTILWSPESEDDGEVVNIQLDTPLEDMVTVDGQIYVSIDSDQGKRLVAEQRTQNCG